MYAALESAAAHRIKTRSAPLSPPDLLQTVAAGSLLFDLDSAQKLLGLQFSPIKMPMKEAVELIQTGGTGGD